jgi:DNA-binding GntR family transcriptional regulator
MSAPDRHNAVDAREPLALPSLQERRSMRGEVGSALRAALIGGQMRPGVVYSAPALAAQFGVSATPVREAMLDLVREGFVETVPNKGFRVTELSDRELDELTEIRRLIEVPTTVAVIDQAEPADLQALRIIADQVVAAAAEKDLIGYIDGDTRFHLGLLALAGNVALVEIVRDLRSRSRLFGLQRLADSGELIESAREHLRLLDLIVTRDRRGLRQLMESHIGQIRGRWA